MTRFDMVLTPMGLRFGGRILPCSIGRGGLTTRKREGDMATPKGVHRIVGMLYRPDRIAAKHLPDWALPIKPGDLWSDDVRDADYNLMVRAPHGYRHENLRRADPLYDLIFITDWNWPYSIRGRGSAIFMHTWRRPGYPTAGCVAMALPDLIWVANRLRHQSRLII
jgi:L,D-peptidoglycan transpeptidase YkuD (ErfK/YbiS/YcfS/YnhG family)